jgi:glycosyltransferase involved in cell wall biosynthesis
MMITGSWPPMPCGVGDYTAKLAAALANTGDIKVTVVTSREAGGAHGRGDVTVLPVIEHWGIGGVGNVLRVLRAIRPDIVHIHSPTQGYARRSLPSILPALSYSSGSRVVQTWHEYNRANSLRGGAGYLLKGIVPGEIIVVRPGYIGNVSRPWRWITKPDRFHLIENVSSIPAVTMGADDRRGLRSRYLCGDAKLVAFFGFLYETKQVHLLFEIARPDRDHLLIIGKSDPENPYATMLQNLAASAPWKGHVTFAGFLPAEQAAAALSVADAVVLPFADGAGTWNTSVHAATVQGTFVLTTSVTGGGYDQEKNIYYAKPGDISEMRAALSKYSGYRRDTSADATNRWDSIAREHVSIYKACA